MCSHSESIAEIAAALSAFQGEVRNPARNKTVKVRSTKASYDFSFATFDSILDHVRPLLSAKGLAVLQSPEIKLEDGKGVVSVTTLLTHKSGEWIRGSFSLPSFDFNPQKIGSLVSYARRYALTSFLGIAGEEDDDANVAEGNEISGKQRSVTAPKETAQSREDFTKRPPPQKIQYITAERAAKFKADLLTTFKTTEHRKAAAEVIKKHGVDFNKSPKVTEDTFEKIREDLMKLHGTLNKEPETNE